MLVRKRGLAKCFFFFYSELEFHNETIFPTHRARWPCFAGKQTTCTSKSAPLAVFREFGGPVSWFEGDPVKAILWTCAARGAYHILS